MSTRLKRLLHLKTDFDDLGDSGGLQRRGSRRVVRSSASIPTSPYVAASPGSPPRTGQTPIRGQTVEDLRENSIASQQSDHSRFNRISFVDKSEPLPPHSPDSICNVTQRLSTIQVGPDLASELKHLTISDEALAKKYREAAAAAAAAQRYPEPRPYKPNRGARLANTPFFQNQQHYAELVASRNVSLSQHPALRSRRRSGLDPEDNHHDLTEAPPVPERDQSRPRYQVTSYGSSFLREREPKTSSFSSSSDARSFTSSTSEPAIHLSTLSRCKDVVYTYREDFQADCASKAALKEPLDLSSSDDVSFEERLTSAVVHERGFPENHDTRREEATREIHDYDTHYGLSPAIDIDVPPARHFVLVSDLESSGAKPICPLREITVAESLPFSTYHPTPSPSAPPTHPHLTPVSITDDNKTTAAAQLETLSGSTLIEVDPHTLPAHSQISSNAALHSSPGDTDYRIHPVVAETIVEMKQQSPPLSSQDPSLLVPLRYTARISRDTEAEDREWTGEDGFKRTETWWVHEPKVKNTVTRRENGGGAEQRSAGGSKKLPAQSA